MLHRFISFSNLSKDLKGSIGVLAGMMLLLLAIFGGMAIDFGRWAHSRQVTQAALDAAVLAGARWLTVNPEDAQGAIETARNHYNENVSSRMELLSDTVDFVVEDNNKSVAATGDATLKTTLMSIAGIDSVPLLDDTGAGLPKASIASGGSNIEVSVMLDVTGSMCDDGYGPCTSSVKLDALKEAAKKLVDIVVTSDQSQVTSKVALVPFSTRVRVGPTGGGGDLMKKLTNLDPSWSGWYKTCVQSTGGGGSEGSGNWQCLQYANQWKEWPIMPCVTDRFYDDGWQFDLTDDAPGPGKWLNAHGGNRKPYYKDSSDNHPYGAPYPNGTSSSPVNHWTYRSYGCSDAYSVNEVMPLTSDKSALNSRIDGLKAFGATAGVQGTAWSWYTLSPKWAGPVWSGEAEPGSYAELSETMSSGQPKRRKVAVLMTDGVYNTYRGWKGQDMGWMSDTAKQMCANMKAKGIEIYTVGLALDELSSSERAVAEDTLQSCGTDIEHFYNTLSSDELVQAFQDIGLSLTHVALTR